MYYNYIFLDLRKPGKYQFDNLNFSLLFEPFYVGKGTKERWKHHKYNKNISHKDKLINLLLCDYELKELVILFNYNKLSKITEDKEILLISDMGRLFNNSGILTNILPGGEGMSSQYMIDNNPMINISHDEHSKKIKEAQWSGDIGKKEKKNYQKKF
jgi:hypothetical protein